MNQASTQSILMKVTGLSKYYGGLTAVNNVNLNIHYGEILALVGDNGAGKSTLVKALAGALKPDSGQIEFEGKEVRLENPRDAEKTGIGCLHQGLGLVDSLNVPENVFLGRELQKKFLGFVPQLDHSSMHEQTIKHLNQFGVNLPKIKEPVINLSGGQRQTIAISRLLLQKVKLVILDEPMAALGVEEGRNVLKLIEKMKSNNISIIVLLFIRHGVRGRQSVRVAGCPGRQPPPGWWSWMRWVSLRLKKPALALKISLSRKPKNIKQIKV